LDDDIRTLHANGKVDLAANPAAAAYLAGNLVLYQDEIKKIPDAINLSAANRAVYVLGEEVFHRDGHCVTCHGEDGAGAVANVYPPLGKTPWVVGDVERMTKIVLKGLSGPIKVGDKMYGQSNSVPPMTAFEGMLNDAELAAVLTYVRMRFGRVGVESNFAQDGLVKPDTVKRVREALKGHTGHYKAEELLAQHPLEGQ
jgi:mono/diheme cytochrome c family protein